MSEHREYAGGDLAVTWQPEPDPETQAFLRAIQWGAALLILLWFIGLVTR